MKSAGLLLYKGGADRLSVLLVHPGGPFWAKRDQGAWSIPKGEIVRGKTRRRRRGANSPRSSVAFEGPLHLLGETVQPGGKRIIAYAGEGDIDCAAICSNSFEIEWPPKSGRRRLSGNRSCRMVQPG